MNNKTEMQSHDYSDLGFECRFDGPILSKAQHLELKKISDDLASKHGVANVRGHRVLTLELWTLMHTGSVVTMEDGVPKPPIDQPTLKSSRAEILKALEHLRKFQDALYETADNETVSEMLQLADSDGILVDHYQCVVEFERILSRAADVTGKKGNVKNPDWIALFCIRCQEFWVESMPGGTRLVFHLEHESRITEWVHDLYIVLHGFVGRECKMSMLHSAAKHLPAKRRPPETI